MARRASPIKLMFVWSFQNWNNTLAHSMEQARWTLGQGILLIVFVVLLLIDVSWWLQNKVPALKIRSHIQNTPAAQNTLQGWTVRTTS